jgi:DNA-binding response OmpR family regulator
MSNPAMLISTEKFMEKIWGFDTETEISVVWVYISYLRRKLQSVGSNVVIKAARGTGYTLEIDNA